jgi:hypothetical protein
MFAAGVIALSNQTIFQRLFSAKFGTATATKSYNFKKS